MSEFAFPVSLSLLCVCVYPTWMNCVGHAFPIFHTPSCSLLLLQCLVSTPLIQPIQSLFYQKFHSNQRLSYSFRNSIFPPDISIFAYAIHRSLVHTGPRTATLSLVSLSLGEKKGIK